ncbi:helix-turn-helix transcriptional regulator [Ferruginibacter profundus]
MEKTIHQGRNIKRFREMLGIKQEAMAYELGEDWNQKKISMLEQKEVVDTTVLQQVAKVLKIPAEAILNFDEEQAISIISNTANFENCQQPAFFNHNPAFNPIEKLIESFEEIKRLNAELLKEKDDKIALLERLLAAQKT